MVDRTGKPVGESSSSAQIRTLFDEQRQMIIAECCEKASHHKLQAARAEEARRILQEDLRRQHKDFREVHQQNLTEMEELRKFQSSTFDTLARRKLIEDQNTILVLSGRVQELQNEVNCMNDSKDFQDAESVRSGNSHVTNQPMLFPNHSYRRATKKGRQAFGIHMVYRETFLQIHMLPLQLLILKSWTLLGRKLLRNRFTCLQRRRVIDRNKIKIWDASLDRQPKIHSSSVRETIQRITGQTNNDCRFRISILTSSLRQQPSFAGR